MEQICVRGLVVREYQVGENDKLLDIVTDEYGKLTVSAKGVKSLRNRNMASSQLFAYSTFTLRKRGKYYYISDSDSIELFFGLRTDIEKLALATYICDITDELAIEDIAEAELLKLTLNTLYALSEKKINVTQIKAAFEMRAASVAGFCPDLVACHGCGSYRPGEMYLDVMNGRLLCADCKPKYDAVAERHDDGTARLYLGMNDAVLDAVRYIIFSPETRYLSFRLDGTELSGLAYVCENYLLNHIGHGYQSLDYFKAIM